MHKSHTQETLIHTKHIGTIQTYKDTLKVRNVNMVKRKNIVMDDNENNDEVMMASNSVIHNGRSKICKSKCEAPVVQLIEHLSHTPKEAGSNHAKVNNIFFRFVTSKYFFLKIYIFQSHMTLLKIIV